VTQAILGLNESRSSIGARAAAACHQVPDGDDGPRVDEQEGRLAAIHASAHLLPPAVRRRKNVGDRLQPMLRRPRLPDADIPAFRDTHSHHNCQDPWLEQRAQGN
jgi:hypothetical protein